jgi:hypothetical protein
MKVSADDYGIRFEWNRYGRPGVALFNRIGGAFLAVAAALMAAPVAWYALTRDWTVVIPWLVLATGAVTHRVAMRKTYGVECRPDYAAIARMERDIWGQAFEHGGAPVVPGVMPPHTVRTVRCPRGHTWTHYGRGPDPACSRCEDDRRASPACARCGSTAPILARGLCQPCYGHLRRESDEALRRALKRASEAVNGG